MRIRFLVNLGTMLFSSLKNLYEQLASEALWRKTLYLRIAVAGCFIGHGVLAYQASTNFGSEWSAWVRSIFPETIEYAASEIFLKSVAIIDIVDGALLLFPRIPKSALAWVFGWGAMTAGSRLFFLGVYVPPLEINMINALAEFFKRAPNWIIPLLLIANTSPQIAKRFRLLEQKNSWLNIAVGSQMLGLYLKQCYEFNSPFFEFELLKFGIPTNVFWLATGSSLIGLFLVILSAKVPGLLRKAPGVFLLVPFAYVITEGTMIYSRNLPGGFTFTSIRFVSHFCQYLTVILWTIGHLKPEREQETHTKYIAFDSAA